MVLAPLLGATGMAKIITLTSDAGLAATISTRTGGTGSPVPSRRREPGDGVVERARAGDDRAWIEIIDRYQPLLRWIAARYRLSSQDAAAVIQVTWLRCIEHVGELHDAEAFGGWLATNLPQGKRAMGPEALQRGADGGSGRVSSGTGRRPRRSVRRNRQT